MRDDHAAVNGPALARNAYAAFILQGVPLLGLAVLMRGLPLPAEDKALVLAVGGVVGSCALAASYSPRSLGSARLAATTWIGGATTGA